MGCKRTCEWAGNGWERALKVMGGNWKGGIERGNWERLRGRKERRGKGQQRTTNPPGTPPLA